MMKKIVTLLLTLTTFLTFSACTPRMDYRGKSPEQKDISKIKAGISTKQDVLNIIGSPTFESTYGSNTWFFVYKKTSTTSFFKPEIVEKNTISITFNAKGVVEEIKDMDPEMQDIKPLAHKTPTVGKDRTMLQQVFSNFGRLARKTKAK